MEQLNRIIKIYQEQYGEEATSLINALTKEGPKFSLLNPFIDQKKILSAKPMLIDGFQSHYYLDFSSYLCAMSIPLEENMRVLDMCSAPGGKLLVMLKRMHENISFWANDASSVRMNRLKRVIGDYLPPHVAAQIKVTSKDGLRFGLSHKDYFDVILLDAPCSSEAHVIKNQTLLNRFKGISKSLPKRQYALLCSALLALKPGGYLMYATCSINKNENQGVIKRVLARKKPVSVVPLTPSIGTVDEYGVTILPHKDNAGPAFFSLLKK